MSIGKTIAFMALIAAFVAAFGFRGDHPGTCPHPVAQSRVGIQAINNLEAGVIAEKRSPQQNLSERAMLRRLWLDLTGRLPSFETVNAYLASEETNKWTAMVDQIMAGDAFVARWTTFFDDMFWTHYLVQSGFIRNNFHEKIRAMVVANMPVDEMARQIINTRGQSGLKESANFYYLKEAFDEGFRLDYLDDQISFITETMLGVQTLCISCHDGAYRLEQVNKGLSTMTRAQFWGMAAFLSKSYLYIDFEGIQTENIEDFLRDLQIIDLDRDEYDPRYGMLLLADGDSQMGEYLADSGPGQGMRPIRNGGLIQPAYFTTAEAPKPEESRRQALARMITADRQFARNIVNRVWAHFMGKGFVDPVVSWDLGRLNETVAAQYESTVQPTTPKLMNWLTDQFIASNYDLRSLIKIIANGPAVNKNATTAKGTWPHVSHWRKQREPRRLAAEAVIDAFYKIHRIPPKLMVTGYLDRTFSNPWEMPGPYEPNPYAIYDENFSEPLVDVRSLGYGNLDEYFFFQEFTLGVMTIFNRGQYDLGIARSNVPSIQHALVLLNHPSWNFWLEGSQSTPFIQYMVNTLNSQADLKTVITVIFHEVLFRDPSDGEMAKAMAYFQEKAPEQGVKDLVWSLFNHPDFLYK